MGQKYHVNGNGEARRCAATKGGCPFGTPEDHYSNANEARAAYEKKMESVNAANYQKVLSPEESRKNLILARDDEADTKEALGIVKDKISQGASAREALVAVVYDKGIVPGVYRKGLMPEAFRSILNRIEGKRYGFNENGYDSNRGKKFLKESITSGRVKDFRSAINALEVTYPSYSGSKYPWKVPKLKTGRERVIKAKVEMANARGAEDTVGIISSLRKSDLSDADIHQIVKDRSLDYLSRKELLSIFNVEDNTEYIDAKIRKLQDPFYK